jgi:hypothetical protein
MAAPKSAKKAEAAPAPVAEAAAPAAPAAEAAPAEASTGRKVLITLDETHAPLVGVNAGDVMARVDYIKARFAAGIKRGDIARELTALNGGKKVAYQIVFAATKTPKAEVPAAAVAAAAE